MDFINLSFLSTNSENLDNIPISNGQIISTINKNTFYYDMGDKRNKVGNISFSNTFPETGETDILYIISNPFGLYLWENENFKPLIPDVGIDDAPADGILYGRKNNEWVNIPNSTGNGIPDAPINNITAYVRYNGEWTSLECDWYCNSLSDEDIGVQFQNIYSALYSEHSGSKIKINVIGNLKWNGIGLPIAFENNDVHEVVEIDFSRAKLSYSAGLGSGDISLIRIEQSNINKTLIVSNLCLNDNFLVPPNITKNIIKSNNKITIQLQNCSFTMKEQFRLIDIPEYSHIFVNSCNFYNYSDNSCVYVNDNKRNIKVIFLGCKLWDCHLMSDETDSGLSARIKAIGCIASHSVYLSYDNIVFTTSDYGINNPNIDDDT